MRKSPSTTFLPVERGDRLQHVGYVDAFDDETAKVYAWTTYSEEKWFEMCVVKRVNVLPVNRTDGLFVEAQESSHD